MEIKDGQNVSSQAGPIVHWDAPFACDKLHTRNDYRTTAREEHMQ